MLIIILAVTTRYQLIDMLPEHGEGEYAYAGQMILQGIPPYKQVYNMQLPGIYAAHAAQVAVSDKRIKASI